MMKKIIWLDQVCYLDHVCKHFKYAGEFYSTNGRASE